jgi:hypothetical protein
VENSGTPKWGDTVPFFNVSNPNDVSVEAVRAHLNYSASAIDTAPRSITNQTSGTLTSGTCFFTFFSPLINLTVSEVSVGSGSTASAGLTYAAVGLYTFDGTTATLVARTASDTTLFNSTFTLYTRSFDTAGGFPATYELVAGQRYALGILITGTTAPTCVSGLFIPNTINALEPRLSGIATGQTELPDTRNTFTQTTTIPWGRFS